MKLFPWPVFKRLVAVQWMLVLTTLFAAGLGARQLFKQTLIAQSQKQQESTLTALSHYWTPESGWCARAAQGTGLRLTLINPRGTVICDSEADPATMDNHDSRPEILAASHSTIGHSFRKSDTLGEEMLYSALRVKPTADQPSPIGPSSNDFWFLRSALHLSELGPMLTLFDRSLIGLLAATALILALVSLLSARSLVLPFAEILRKFQKTGPHTGDWNELEDSINSLSRELNNRLEDLLTERAQQSTVLSAISDGILAIDRNGIPLFFNSRFELYFGHGLKLRESNLWGLFRVPEMIESFRKAIEHGQNSTLTFSNDSLPDGKRTFSVSIAPLTRSSGETYGAVGIFHDISDIKQAEQLRIDFVANVSHELRTPLTAIKGYADTLMADTRSGRSIEPEFLEVIHRNSERLMALIQDLLDISALESSAVLQRTSVPVAPISQRIIESLQPVMKSRNQECHLSIGSQSVFADSSKLEQVLVNLLDNASKYSGQNSQIDVSWEASGQPSGTGDNQGVLLKVHDNGPGIPAEHLPRLFERFYRIDKARSRDQGGTGLGLAIVKHILMRHGGKIWVESSSGNGTTFFCLFPSADAKQKT